MYYCTECKRKHRTGAIYEKHLKYKENGKKDPKKYEYLKELASINRKIMFGNYDLESIIYLKKVRRELKEKIEKCK